MMRESRCRTAFSSFGSARASEREARSPTVSENPVCGQASARRFTTLAMAMLSARSDFMNLRRAGVAENRPWTSTTVPPRAAAGLIADFLPASTEISKSAAAPAVSSRSATGPTEPSEGNASPRKPSVGYPANSRRRAWMWRGAPRKAPNPPRPCRSRRRSHAKATARHFARSPRWRRRQRRWRSQPAP